jgi:hypothetical protein
MEKVIRDGKVAVLISHGFGAGWYSWNLDHKEILFHPKLVEMVEQDKRGGITEEWVKENLGIEWVYCGGAEELQIVWLPVGTAFMIGEYNGAESLMTMGDLVIIA